MPKSTSQTTRRSVKRSQSEKGKKKPVKDHYYKPVARTADTFHGFLKEQFAQEKGRKPKKGELNERYNKAEKVAMFPFYAAARGIDATVHQGSDKQARINASAQKQIASFKGKPHPKPQPAKPTTGPRFEASRGVKYTPPAASKPATAAAKHMQTQQVQQARQQFVGGKKKLEHMHTPNHRTALASAGVTGSDVFETKQDFFYAPAQIMRNSPSTYHSEPKAVKHTLIGEGGKRTTHDGMSIRCRERLSNCTIDTSTNSQGAVILRIVGNPNSFNSARGKTFATMYQMCQYGHFSVHYTGGQGVGMNGELAGYFDPDPTDLPPTGEAGLTVGSNHPGWSTTHPYNSKSWHMPGDCLKPIWTKQMNLGFSTTGQFDSEMRDTAQFQFLGQISQPISGASVTVPAPTATPLTLGTWHVEYECTFFMMAIDEVVYGTNEIDMNTAYSTSDVASTNITYTRCTGSMGGISITNHPAQEGDLTSFFGSTEDYAVTGAFKTGLSWISVTPAQSLAWATTAGTPWYLLSSSGINVTSWFPTFPSVPQIITVNVRGTTTTSANNNPFYLFVSVSNVDDTTGTAPWVHVTSDGAITTNPGTQAPATALIANVGTAQRLNASWCTASMSFIVDPSAYRYNASRFAVSWIVYQPSELASVSFSGTGKYIQLVSTALTADQQVYWGVPQYAPRQMLSTGKPKALELSDIGACYQDMMEGVSTDMQPDDDGQLESKHRRRKSVAFEQAYREYKQNSGSLWGTDSLYTAAGSTALAPAALLAKIDPPQATTTAEVKQGTPGQGAATSSTADKVEQEEKSGSDEDSASDYDLSTIPPAEQPVFRQFMLDYKRRRRQRGRPTRRASAK